MHSARYDKIINLPHHVSKKRRRMLISERAAQFAPFAALVGHDEAIKEVARGTKESVGGDEKQEMLMSRGIE